VKKERRELEREKEREGEVELLSPLHRGGSERNITRVTY
jgi:hypothetical protein